MLPSPRRRVHGPCPMQGARSRGIRNPVGNHNPEACTAQANSQIGGTIGEKPKRNSFDLAAASAHARRHRARPDNDREWYHVMTSSADGCHLEQVLQRRHVLKRSSTVGRCALTQLPPLHMWQKSSPVMPPSGVQADNYWRNQRVFQEDLVERCVHHAF